jgi:hypothetical protein
MQKGTTSRVMVATMPKVSFWPDRSTSLRNYGNTRCMALSCFGHCVRCKRHS